ncbi:MAG: oxygen-independent coproporphyrinogen III oxidase [Stappiaceae bacterium]
MGSATSLGMTPLEKKYATRTVPRYTSYPTAPQFSGQIGSTDYGTWLDRLPATMDLSLYLHVPFCRAMCHYCGCNTKASKKDAPILDYSRTLIDEIELVGSRLGRKQSVSHIHWGGGTPSLLPRDSLFAVADALRTAFCFGSDMEHAIELDPRSVDETLADSLHSIGITRASLGVQDFNSRVQLAIGRVQSFQTVANAVDALRNVGITAINFDLMYGLPHQNEETITQTISDTVRLQPSRIALFGYAHVPWMKKHQRLINDADLPDSDARMAQATLARDLLIEYGYVAIGLDHFALPADSMAKALSAGTLRRNFQGYTTDRAQALVGLGASSIGFLPGGYAQNAPDVSGWKRDVEAGRFPIAKGIALSADDRLRATIIERIMSDHQVDLLKACEEHQQSPECLEGSMALLDEMLSDGLLIRDEWRIALTEVGRPFSRIAAAAFDTYLDRSPARHSVAV